MPWMLDRELILQAKAVLFLKANASGRAGLCKSAIRAEKRQKYSKQPRELTLAADHVQMLSSFIL